MKNIVFALCVLAIMALAYTYYVYTAPLPLGRIQNVPDITVSLSINDETHEFIVPESISLYDMMKLARQRGIIQFREREFEGVGLLIEEINGISNDIEKDAYWSYSINGRNPSSGITEYSLKANDLIQWRYTKNG